MLLGLTGLTHQRSLHSMAKFTSAAFVEDTVWTMRLGDYPRSLNRARINDLFNGVAPFSAEYVQQNNAVTNVNFLESTKLAQDARGQGMSALTKPVNYFTITEVDRGPKHKRKGYAATLTKLINRKAMKQSLKYYETLRSVMANVVLHGIGPVIWDDTERWCPNALGVEDVLVPSNTKLDMDSLPFFAIFRPYTALQLYRLTHGPKVDPGWNMDLVNKCIEQADKEIIDFGVPYNDLYAPEKIAERMKSDSGLYSADSVPTINAWDFFFYDDDDGEAGWRRRVVLDANWQLGYGGVPSSLSGMNTKVGTKGEFLYDSKDRVYAEKISQIVHFQFGDLSSVAPFRYHSVRSLGFLMYAVCNLQNRLRCKFNDSLFEHMLQYFRVRNLEEYERTLKINLIEKGIIDETVNFVPAAERWTVDAGLIAMGLSQNRDLMASNSSSYVQQNQFGQNQQEKTATQVMAEVNNNTQLISAALGQEYMYQKFQYKEITRRFTLKNSLDADVKKFRLEALKAGIPEEVLDYDCWEIEPDKTMGAGNKTLEMAISDKMMAVRNLFDPDAQRDILRDYTLSVTDDPGRTERLVPEQPVLVTEAVHDAQLAAASLLLGMKVDVKAGMNHIEYIETMLGQAGLILQQIQMFGGKARPQQLIGIENMIAHTAKHIAILAQDKNEKQRVKQYGDAIGQIMNQVKALTKQMQQAMQAAQQQNGQPRMSPDEAAKVQATQAMSQAKMEASARSNAQKTAQRQTQFEITMQQDAEKHQQQLEQQANEALLKTGQEVLKNQAEQNEPTNPITE